jgi:hypothetical protein
MDKNTVLLKKAYYAFNTRNIDNALAAMHPDVKWPNGQDGGYVCGHDEIRSYWTRQWGLIDPDVEPVQITPGKNGNVVADVHQVIRDLEENVISDEIVQHVYLIENGLIKNMHIQTKSI